MSTALPTPVPAHSRIFGGLDLSEVGDRTAGDELSSQPGKESLSHRRQRQLADAIRSGDLSAVQNATAAFPENGNLPTMLRGERAAEILAKNFSLPVANHLLSSGLVVPTTQTFLDCLHEVGNVEGLDWFLKNTVLGSLASPTERSFGRLTRELFSKSVREVCHTVNHDVAMYYLERCHLTVPPRPSDEKPIFRGYSLSPLFKAALRSEDVQRISQVVQAISRHGEISNVIRATVFDLEWKDILALQKSCENRKTYSAVSSAFPMRFELSFYCQPSLSLLGVDVPAQSHLAAQDLVEAIALTGAPALGPLLGHETHGKRIAEYLISPSSDSCEASRRLAYFSAVVQEARLESFIPDLYRWAKDWRDSHGNNVGHYLASRPTTDPKQERNQTVQGAVVAVASVGPGARGELLVQHAREWCLQENEAGKTPLSFIAPKARAQITRQLLRAMAPSRQVSRKADRPGM